MQTITAKYHVEGESNPAVFNNKTAICEHTDDVEQILSYVDELLKPYRLEVVKIDGDGSQGDMTAFRIDKK